jgi:hypothetical protein
MPEAKDVSVVDGSAEVKSTHGDEDLASEIARSIPRKPREQVTCRRVTKNNYRCNWWTLENTAPYDNPGMAGLLVTTSRICQSEFLHAVKVGGDLKIEVVTRKRAAY